MNSTLSVIVTALMPLLLLLLLLPLLQTSMPVIGGPARTAKAQTRRPCALTSPTRSTALQGVRAPAPMRVTSTVTATGARVRIRAKAALKACRLLFAL
jgi:hypothetical protein